jgi:hypothetical protein
MSAPPPFAPCAIPAHRAGAALSRSPARNKTDMQLKQDIEAELSWDPKVNAAQIGVTVDGGAVSLLGSVDTYAEKWAAEDATRRVSGVRSVAQDLTVKLLLDHKHTDSEIAAAALNALRWDVFVPRSNGALTKAMAILPRSAVDATTKLFKADKVLVEVDDRARLAYQDRATQRLTGSSNAPSIGSGDDES